MEKSRYEHCIENHKPLRFGTNGLRDEDNRLTDMQIYICTKGFLNYLVNNNLAKKGYSFALAGDFRPSTPRILIAISLAILEKEFKVNYFGKIPTPTLAYYSFHNKIPSAMVTASHNPYGQNGVKFMKPEEEVMKEDEEEILNEVSNEREKEYMKEWEESMFDKDGLIKKFEELNIMQQFLVYSAKKALKNINNKAREFYIERYRKTFGKILSGVKLVFYQQTTVGRDIIPYVLEELGAEVIKVGKVDETREFVPIDTEDMKPAILERMANFAFDNNCDVCISADGDADRPAVLYLKKDKQGNFLYKNDKLEFRFIKGDILNVLVSLLIKPDYVAVPIHLNHKAGFGVLGKNNIIVKLTRIGEPPVIKAMKEIIRLNAKTRVYGFEANGGGILLKDFYIPEIGEISSLAARDALFPIVCVLALAKKMNLLIQGLYENIFSGENFSHCHSGLVENLPGVSVTKGLERYSHDVGRRIVNAFKPLNENIYEIDFNTEQKANLCLQAEDKALALSFCSVSPPKKSSGFLGPKKSSERFLRNPRETAPFKVRYKSEGFGDDHKIIFSNEKEETVDEKDVEHLVKIRNILYSYVMEIIEMEIKITRINFLDGVKVYLDNKEIIHLRPSGNASQFRIYIESPDEERAIMLVEKAVRHYTGWLVKFINDFIDKKMILEK